MSSILQRAKDVAFQLAYLAESVTNGRKPDPVTLKALAEDAQTCAIHLQGLESLGHSGYSIFKDGNQWRAVGPEFINLQESAAGFGDTPEAALAALVEAYIGAPEPEPKGA